MNRGFSILIEPVIEAIRPKSIVEIGSDEGINTRNLLDYCVKNDAVVHVVDPAPNYDPAELRDRYGHHFDFYEALSLDVLPTLDGFDLVLVDGDHNWYTVFHELKTIEERSEALGQPYPLVMLDDVAWPCGRRDLYFDPERIPDAYRQPNAMRGARPGVATLCETGGVIQQHYKAIEEGGPRNGVLTAVEDYLEQTEQPLRFLMIPGYQGFGILVPPHLEENPQLADILETWDLPPSVARYIEGLDNDWRQAQFHSVELRARLKDLRTRREGKGERLKATRKELAEVRRQLKEAHERLAAIERRPEASAS